MGQRGWTAALLLAVWSAFALAADSGDAAPAARFEYFNRDIATFRVSLAGYGPSERAANARMRMQAILEQQGPGLVDIKTRDGARVIQLDGGTVFMLLPDDVDPLADENLDVIALAASRRLQEAVEASRESRSLAAWSWALGAVAAATAVWFVVMWLLAWARRRLAVQLSLAVRARLDRLKVAGVHAVQPAMLQTFTRRFVTLITWIIGGAFTYGWLVFALERLPYTRPWGRELEHHLVDLLKFVGLAIVGAIPGLVLVAVIVLITRGVQQAGAFFFDRVEGGQIRIGWLDADTAKPTRRIAMLVLWLFALAMAYPYLPGANTDAFKGLSVLVGLMISIGASSLVGQAFSGLILMYSRALRVGEFVRIGDAEGTVTELGLFATRVRTGMGEELVMPNAVVIGQVTRNYSRTVQGTGFVLHTTVTIGYDAPWRQVHAMLLEAATRTRGVLSTPAPLVLQTALSDYYVEYRLVATAGPEAPRLRAEAMSALHANIQDVFNEHGVQIMSPHYMEDPARAKVVPPEDWYPPPAKPPTPHET